MSDEETQDDIKYTKEQKIVAAVWVHEKSRNGQSWKDINRNFIARFGLNPPTRSTFLNWEKKLFSTGNVEDEEKSGRPLLRLMHVPYVKASLEESPNLSLRERAQVLGLSRTTLLNILHEDLNMEFHVEENKNLTSNPNKRHAPYNNGYWKKKKPEDDTAPKASTSQISDNDEDHDE